MEGVDERGEGRGLARRLGERDLAREDAPGVLRLELGVGVDEDEAEAGRDGERDRRDEVRGVRGRDEDEAAEDRGEAVVAVPRAVGGVLAAEDGLEEDPLARLAEEEGGRLRAGGGRGGRGAEAAREGEALLERELDARARRGPPGGDRRLEDPGRGDGGGVPLGVEREPPAVARDLDEPARPASSPSRR